MGSVKLVAEMDESEFAAGVQELVDATAPRLFAIVAELGEREDACVAAWGMEIDGSAVLVLAGERPAFMLCDSPSRHTGAWPDSDPYA